MLSDQLLGPTATPSSTPICFPFKVRVLSLAADCQVTNFFNPAHPLAPGQLAPISVEDVTAYFKLVKDDVGINHEDELVQALIALTEKVHPLAVGNVQRHHNQSRLTARKLLRLHMGKAEEHEIEKLIDNLKSNLFYHSHPIPADTEREATSISRG